LMRRSAVRTPLKRFPVAMLMLTLHPPHLLRRGVSPETDPRCAQLRHIQHAVRIDWWGGQTCNALTPVSHSPTHQQSVTCMHRLRHSLSWVGASSTALGQLSKAVR
jgi:hypothetical protein